MRVRIVYRYMLTYLIPLAEAATNRHYAIFLYFWPVYAPLRPSDTLADTGRSLV